MNSPEIFLKGNPLSYVASKRLANKSDFACLQRTVHTIETGYGEAITRNFIIYYGQNFLIDLIITIYGEQGYGFLLEHKTIAKKRSRKSV